MHNLKKTFSFSFLINYICKRFDHSSLKQGSPTPGPRTGTGLQPVRNQAAQQEVSGGQTSQSFICCSPLLPLLALLPEPSPPPHPFRGKIVFHETGPWCQKGWGPLL